MKAETKMKINGLKKRIKDRTPQIVAAVSTLTAIAAVVYAQNVKKQSSDCNANVWPDDFTGLRFDDSTRDVLLEDPSQICYKIDDDHHYSLAPNGCADDH